MASDSTDINTFALCSFYLNYFLQMLDVILMLNEFVGV